MCGVSGVADLPLHEGQVPPWLARLMLKLSRSILEVMLLEFSSEDILKRFSNPLWFQAFNNVIGMDWDSSGSTTVTTAMIKHALNELEGDVRLAGGKGLASRKTPEEIHTYGVELGVSTATADRLVKVSQLEAKTDSVLLQDGFTLYHHTLAFDRRGNWVVIQQGMNPVLKLARRYHLAWFVTNDPTLEPHTGVASDVVDKPLNLTVRESHRVRKLVVDLANESPESTLRRLRIVNAHLKGNKTLTGLELQRPLVRGLPYYRPVELNDRILKELREAYELKPRTVEELLLIKGLGAEVVRALALISELIYREPPPLEDIVTHSFSPFKYAYAVGGKDGVPYPVKRELVLSIVKELSRLVREAKLEGRERMAALRALRRLAPEDVEGI